MHSRKPAQLTLRFGPLPVLKRTAPPPTPKWLRTKADRRAESEACHEEFAALGLPPIELPESTEQPQQSGLRAEARVSGVKNPGRQVILGHGLKCQVLAEDHGQETFYSTVRRIR